MRRFLFLFAACHASSSIGYLAPPGATDSRIDLGPAFAKRYTVSESHPIALATTDGSELELRSLDADVTIDGPVAHTELHLVFHNPENRLREGRFAMTLPAEAAVARFAMHNADGWREARVVSREQGRQVYERFLKRRVDPALLEHDAGNAFSARVYPITANADKELILAYDEPVTSAYRLAVPQAGRVAVAVTVDGRRLSFDRPQDVVVPLESGDVAAIDGDTFAARVDAPSEAAAAPLDRVAILVDTSASRAPIMARQLDVVRRLVAALPEDSEVVIAAFDQGVREVYRGPAAQADADRLASHGALGASDLGAALDYAATAGTTRVVIVGDGTPTLGEREPAKLAAHVHAARVDAIQVGTSLDRDTLAAIVAAGRAPGAILDGSEPERAAHQLATALPAEREIHVDGATETWPATTAGAAPGEPIWVFGHGDPAAIHVGDHVAQVHRHGSTHAHRLVAGAEIATLTDRARIRELALANMLVTSETSFIVFDNDADERMALGEPPPDTTAAGSPTIDPTSTTQGITLDKNYLKNIPVPGRTFEAALGAAAGSQNDGIGTSFSGSSALENQYYVDGVNTTGLTFGSEGESIAVRAEAPIIDPEIGPTPMPDDPEFYVHHMTDQLTERNRAVESYQASPPDRPHYAEPYTGVFKDVLLAIHRGDRELALALATRWQADAPGDVAALISLGEAFEARGQVGLAARAYGSIIDLYPDRAELARAAGERLDRLHSPLAIDAYRRAIAERPDQASTYRLLAFALVRAGQRDEALRALRDGDARVVRPSVHELFATDIAAIEGRLQSTMYVALSWETDANDVDLHVTDRHGDESWYGHKEIESGGGLLEDITDGFGPEMFEVERPKAFPYKVAVHYYARGPMGIGLGSVQVVRTDANGKLTVDDRPFVIQNDSALVQLGVIN